jgi:hypothetical protein
MALIEIEFQSDADHPELFASERAVFGKPSIVLVVPDRLSRDSEPSSQELENRSP